MSRTEHRTGSGFKGLTLQTPPFQEVAVGRAGVTGEAAGSVQSAQEQKHRTLVVTNKVRLPCWGGGGGETQHNTAVSEVCL